MHAKNKPIEIGAKVRDRDVCEPGCCTIMCSFTEGIVVGEIYWGRDADEYTTPSETKKKPTRVLFVVDDNGEVHEMHANEVERVHD